MIENDNNCFKRLVYEIIWILCIEMIMIGHQPYFRNHVDKAISFISVHHSENCTIKRLAREIGLSEGHLAYLYSTELQMTVKEFVTQVRIEIAKQLLADQSYTLEHIAEMVGFSDASHLSRVFRRLVGHSPRAYSRKITGI